MVPYHNPIPDRKQRDKNGTGEPGRNGFAGGMMSAWVQAEKMMQIAMMLPCAGFIGWLAGYGLDRWLHQAWIGMAGAVFGVIAGLVGAVRMAMAYSGNSASEKSDENGNGAKTGDSGKSS
jgi:F0F1-type ATP synthase assembly protein I